jgi:hypothetical protein
VPRQANTSNIYDLVEREAARRGIPRLELWQAAVRAILASELLVLDLSKRMNPKESASTWGDWFVGFCKSVDRFNDPNGCARILRQVCTPTAHFEVWLRKWQRKVGSERRGPKRGTTGYQDVDRKLIPQMKRLLKTGARSPHEAATKLVAAGKVVGAGSPGSKAKRLVKLYYKER